jgi:hypothetical protein
VYGDVAERVVVCGRAYHGLRGAGEAQQLGDQPIVDGLDGTDAVAPGVPGGESVPRRGDLRWLSRWLVGARQVGTHEFAHSAARCRCRHAD